MAPPLAACLAVVLALQASAQSGRKNPWEFKAELTRNFAAGENLSDLDVSGQPDAVVKLVDQAKYVQVGREPGDEKETYIALVRSVARRLGTRADLAVELYGDRVRPGRDAAAAQREIDARAAIANDVRRNPNISTAKKARLARDLRETSAYLKMGLNGDVNFAGGPPERPAERKGMVAVAPPPTSPGYDWTDARNWSNIPPRAQPLSLVTHPTPSPTSAGQLPSASAGMMSWASLTSHFDWERGKKVATEALTNTLDYVVSMGRICWNFVKRALIDAGIMDVPNPQSTGLIGVRSGAARMFSEDVEKNPNILEKMGYRQVALAGASNDPSSVPDGSMLIYAAGCAFADKTNGHAEITLSEATYNSLRSQDQRLRVLTVDANEVRVCHFSCTARSMPFLRTYGKKGCLHMYVPVKST